MYKRVVNKFFRGVIDQAKSEEDKEIVRYGLEVILSQTVSSLALLLIGLSSHNLLGTVIFIFCFCSIRVVAGGYHANTHLFCFLNTVLSYSFFIVINTYVTREYNVVFMLIAGIFYFIILGLAPVLNDKREFSMDEIQKSRKKTRVFLIFELIISIVLYQFSFELYKFAIYAVILEGVYAILGKMKYWNLNKQALLKNVMHLSMAAALSAAWSTCGWYFHEPEMPKSLKDRLEKDKEKFDN
ncbi:accessory gene regulator B [Lachnotalea glycerini]|uniref:Accessory gene regulator B n=1 Tax=Lachnotalea glycerini TaxID=1763509 RepID=A0A318EN51_9FIRM|nr:cyclic lactone autoinducer peptide [Lachnotalea glycerini]OYO41202.1 hypothetical protein CG709_21320 [Lachnotalea glycerini]PXV91549.1 accessory gene regulator B [Lachnotalea glycerini]RDY29997.1 cyclic lactone autoinducer peptide [Lachnotalea glycerini]